MDEEQVKCFCGIPAALRVVTKEGNNHGRSFYACACWTPSSTDHCSFFKWAPPGTVAPTPTPASPPPQRWGGAATTPPQGNRRPAPTPSPASGRSPAPPLIIGGPPTAPGSPYLYPVRVALLPAGPDAFGASFSYNEPLKDFLKTLPSPARTRWNPEQRLWVFDNAAYDTVIAELRDRSPVPIIVTPLIRQQDGGASGGASGSAAPLPPLSPPRASTPPPGRPGVPRASAANVNRRFERLGSLRQRLYPFQLDAVRFGLERGGRVLLGDEMGLGKTVQALALAAAYGPEDWPLLIVAPSSMRLVWVDAVREWLPHTLQPTDDDLVSVSDGRRGAAALTALAAGPSARPRIVVISYDMLRRVYDSLRALKPKTIIADESHHLKSAWAQRTVAFRDLAASARRLIFLSGTPLPSRPIELFPQLDILRPGLFGCATDFGLRYCAGRLAADPRWSYGGTGYDFSGASNMNELKERIERDIMVRRTKAALLTQLPTKRRRRVEVGVPPGPAADALARVRAQMEALEERAARMRPDLVDVERQRLLGELYRATGAAKVSHALDHVRALLAAGKKVLVFAHHKSVLDAIESGLLRGGSGGGGGGGGSIGMRETEDGVIELLSDEDETEVQAPAPPPKRKRRRGGQALPPPPVVRIDGSVPQDRRKAAVDAFQKDPTVRAAVLSITAAGQGLTLTAATVAVFAELFWTPGQLTQAEDRFHRIGQHSDVEVHYLTAPGTADDVIWGTLSRKLGVVSAAVGGEAGAAGASPGAAGRAVFADMELADRYRSAGQVLAAEAARAEAEAANGAGGSESVEDEEIIDMRACDSLSDAPTRQNSGAEFAAVCGGGGGEDEGDSGPEVKVPPRQRRRLDFDRY